MNHQQTVLVAGGAGFIGSYVVKRLNQAGYQTVTLDNLSRGKRQAVCYGQFIEGDIGNIETLNQIFNYYQIDAVMHFAAFIDVGESVENPSKYYFNNVVNTLTLLNSMLKHRIKTFIFSSSAAIFGVPLYEGILEDHPCFPINPYGETKWMVEKILRDFDLAYGLKSCCLRYFNAAGGDPDREIKNYQIQVTNLIPLALRKLEMDQPLTIFGTDYSTPDGTCIRDYIHIADLATAHLVAMEKLLAGASSSYYNLGNGQGYSVREVVQAIEKVTGKKLVTIEGARRPGDPPILLANAHKAAQELGWHPRYTALETMIEHAWKTFAFNSPIPSF
jgi:UDP-glucose 4-epimerase